MQINQNNKLRQVHLKQKNIFLDENDQPQAKQIFNQTNPMRQPFMDITNFATQKTSCKKPSGPLPDPNLKTTKHFTYLTFLDKTALKQFKVCLYVDRELGIPSEYAQKLQDHTDVLYILQKSIDNDVATDEEQIQSATRKLRSALEEEVFMQRELEEALLEEIMYREVERWESEEQQRLEQEKKQNTLEFEMLIKNQKMVEPRKQLIDQLHDRVFVSYQQTAKKPFTLKSHERLLYKTIEKSVPKFREAFKTKSGHYRAFLAKKLKEKGETEKINSEKMLQNKPEQISSRNSICKISSSDNLCSSL